MKRLLLLTLCSMGIAASLVGCGEKVQTATPRKTDQFAWQGADDPFVVRGWKAGDRTSWEDQLRTRTQQGQNEYLKAK
jgi:hypothetical protein